MFNAIPYWRIRERVLNRAWNPFVIVCIMCESSPVYRRKLNCWNGQYVLLIQLVLIKKKLFWFLSHLTLKAVSNLLYPTSPELINPWLLLSTHLRSDISPCWEWWDWLYISLYDILVFHCPVYYREMSTQIWPNAKRVLKLLALRIRTYVILIVAVLLNQLVFFISLVRFLSPVVSLTPSLDISCPTMPEIHII